MGNALSCAILAWETVTPMPCVGVTELKTQTGFGCGGILEIHSIIKMTDLIFLICKIQFLFVILLRQ